MSKILTLTSPQLFAGSSLIDATTCVESYFQDTIRTAKIAELRPLQIKLKFWQCLLLL